MHASSSSALVALVASALLASQAEALPTHRSTSSVSRRAHLAVHHPNHGLRRSLDGTTSLSGRAKRTETGDHAIVVDASTNGNTQGGIRNSTINLTSISKRQERESTLSSFARVVRSFFGGESSAASPSSASTSALPLTARTRPAKANKKRSTAPSPRLKRMSMQQREVAAGGAKASRSLAAKVARQHSPVPNKKRATRAAAKVEERDVTYTDAAAQASAYSAAVAALDAMATASPVVNAAQVAPSAAAYSSSSPSPVNSTAEPVEADLPPITMTVTLVPSGVNGAYVDAAALASPTATSDAPSLPNPKATASSSALPSSSELEPAEPLSTLVLTPSSPAPEAADATSTGFAKVKRALDAHQKRAPRKVHVGGVAVTGSKIVWYKADNY
ncbi:hypothetical protein JCM10213_004820 [Rhodosporidiobolus nylandii]